MSLDPDGQPLNLAFNRAGRTERDISEMLGLAKGVLADGVITDAEGLLLRDWMRAHPDACASWAIRTIYERLERAFEDGALDEAERVDLSVLLESLVGGQAGIIAGDTAVTELPVDRPPPEIHWKDSIFVFTGQFAFGPRAECVRETMELGGECENTITRRTRYLVLGTFGSRDWAHTSFGRKIDKAVEYRDKGVPLAIVAEDHWASALTAVLPHTEKDRNLPRPSRAPTAAGDTLQPPHRPVNLPGPGRFDVEIVGESHYQVALEAICGPRTDDGEDRVVEAWLVLEDTNPYDALAVRVDIDGHPVGYLSRANARAYREQLAAQAVGVVRASCLARIRGGWDRGPDDHGFYGVFLDLPTDG
jgi:hypothetical protein